EKFIKSKRLDITQFSPEIRLICVVSEIEERVKNACYVISNPVQIITYSATRLESGDILIVPKIEVDNTEVDVAPETPRPEEELIKDHPQLAALYRELRNIIASFPEVEVYTTSRAIRFRQKRVFAKVSFRKNYIFLELRVGPGVSSERFKYWRRGASPWGYLKISSKDQLDGELKSLIEKAYSFQGLATEEVEGEE
ncbi:MAG: DUF5655 domain-containing protein, partial [Candidatus Methylomirabilales bacterium]